MPRSHGTQTRVLVNGSHLSGSITGWRFQHRRSLQADVTVLTSTGNQFMPGQISGGLGIAGVWNSTAADITDVLDTAAGVAGGLLTTIFPETPAVGSLAFIGEGNVSALDYPAPVKDAVRVALEATPNDGVDIAVTLHVLGAETADGNGSSVDNAASSANGGVASLHVPAFTGLTSIVVKVQHSTDNSAWSDLITFTTVTAAESWERKTVTGTVNRYTRALWDVTGTGSAEFAVAFARR